VEVGSVSCPACGSANRAGQRFCVQCGAVLAPPPESVPGPQAAPPGAAWFPPLPPYEGRSKPRAGILAGLIVTGCVLVFIALLVGVAMPNYNQMREKAKEAEVKANLHSIQLAVERFAVDQPGHPGYPEYLIGGSAKWAAHVQDSTANAFTDVQPCKGLTSDPLLRFHYLNEYPRNPFIHNDELSIHRVQEAVTQPTAGDPLRNGPGGLGETLGTRFGPECSLMGQVLCDPRYPLWVERGAGGGAAPSETGATVEYRYWDVWAGAKPASFLPGEFFYKSWNGVFYSERPDFRAQPAGSVPLAQQYLIGGYGGPKTKGQDVLGDEIPLPQTPAGSAGNHGEAPDLRWTWVRSLNDPGQYGGCPYEINVDADGEPRLWHGLQNGIEDSIVLVLFQGI